MTFQHEFDNFSVVVFFTYSYWFATMSAVTSIVELVTACHLCLQLFYAACTEATLVKQLSDLRAVRSLAEQQRDELMWRAQQLQKKSQERTVNGV